MAMDWERFQGAMALRDSGREEDAIRELRAMGLEALDPDEKAAHIDGEAVCLLRLGRLDEARKCNRRAADVSVSRGIRARIDFTEAVICWEERKFKESLGLLNKMLKEYSELLSTPDFRDLYEKVHQRRAILLAEFDRHREACPLLEEALSFQLDAEDKALLLYYLGVALYKLGDKLGARTRFLEALQDRPDDYGSISSRFYYYYVKLRRSVSFANYAATIRTLVGPGKQQALDLTTRLRQGPPRSFFCCATFPRSGKHALT